MILAELRAPTSDPFIRRLAAARRADLAARLHADIAEAERRATLPRGETSGTIDVPQCMLDAFGLTQETT